MKTLILAEKPSVARDFVKAGIDKFKNNEGYYEGEQYIVSFAVGHLLELFMPNEYDDRYKVWDINLLPFVPEKVKYKVKPATKKQFNILSKILKRKDVNKVIIATDAGREGELIGRLVLQETGFKGDIYRFWTSKALTPDVIKETLRNLKEGKEFERMFLAGQARQLADWLIGINGTMAYTSIMYNMFSVGRVQTPVLRLLAERQLEIENFKPEDYWNIFIDTNKGGSKDVLRMQFFFKNNQEDDEESGTRIKDEKLANQIYEAVKVEKNAVVTHFQKQEKSTTPPLLFNLSDIQSEASKLYGYGAEETLNLVQDLYEKYHCVSYPRSSSRHLNEEMKSEVKKILNKIANVVEFDNNKVNIEKAGKRVFDSSKLSDHHAIIPLDKADVSKMSAKHKNIYLLIVKRFIAAFYPNYKYLSVVVEAVVSDRHYFKSNANQTIDLGWKEIYGSSKEDNEFFFDVKKGDVLSIQKTDIHKKQTTPPSYYTEGTLIKAMENAGKFVQDSELKKIIKETDGIGTEATRAGIIETLKKRGYITVSGKKILVTDKGMSAFNILKTEDISSIDLTALWEKTLAEIERGNVGLYRTFIQEVIDYTHKFIKNLKGRKNEMGIQKTQLNSTKNRSSTRPQKSTRYSSSSPSGAEKTTSKLPMCPKCGSQLAENTKSYYCTGYRAGCNFSIWFNSLEKLGHKKITLKELKKLVKDGSCVFKLKSKAGNEYEKEGKLIEKNGKHVIEIQFN
jgi:DNA topoisomerase-3